MWIEVVIILNPYGVWRKVVLEERILLLSQYGHFVLFIVTSWICLDCWMDDQGISVQFLRGVREFSANFADQLWGTTWLLFRRFWEGKVAICKANQPSAGVKGKNGWSTNSTHHLSSGYSEELFTFCYTNSCASSCCRLVFRRFLIRTLAGFLFILTQVFMEFLNCSRLMLDIYLTITDLDCVKTFEQNSHRLLCAWWDCWCLNWTGSSHRLLVSELDWQQPQTAGVWIGLAAATDCCVHDGTAGVWISLAAASG
jgi:hypothetical protein